MVAIVSMVVGGMLFLLGTVVSEGRFARKRSGELHAVCFTYRPRGILLQVFGGIVMCGSLLSHFLFHVG